MDLWDIKDQKDHRVNKEPLVRKDQMEIWEPLDQLDQED